MIDLFGMGVTIQVFHKFLVDLGWEVVLTKNQYLKDIQKRGSSLFVLEIIMFVLSMEQQTILGILGYRKELNANLQE